MRIPEAKSGRRVCTSDDVKVCFGMDGQMEKQTDVQTDQNRMSTPSRS